MRIALVFERFTEDGKVERSETLAACGAIDAVRVGSWSAAGECA
jgi:hypothetical protein